MFPESMPRVSRTVFFMGLTLGEAIDGFVIKAGRLTMGRVVEERLRLVLWVEKWNDVAGKSWCREVGREVGRYTSVDYGL